MRRLLLAFTFVALPLASAIGLAQPPAPSQSGLPLEAMDRTADPCVDFYQFACGAWTANNPIPADRSTWGRFDELQEHNNETLRAILENAAAGKDAQQKKIGDYYGSCMDEAAIDRKATTPLEPLAKKIDALASAADLPPLVAELHTIGVNVFFTFGSIADFKDASVEMAIADQGGLGLPDRDYYSREDPKSADIRKEYVAHIGRIAKLVGASTERAAANADTVMTFETALAKHALDNVSRRDPNKIYHRMAPDDLQKLTPNFQWSRYFTALGAPPIYALNVTEPEFFKGLGELLVATPIADVKHYLRWQLLHASAAMLPTAFVDENFKFYGAILTGAKELRPRWKRCVQYTDGDLGEELGQAFVKEKFGPQAKADTLKMVHEVEAALEKDIHALSWMADATRTQAIAKLHAVSDKIGYPDRWRDYRGLTIVRGDAIGNSQRANAFEFRRQLSKIGKPVDKSEWRMTPPTVNAYYNPLENNINFPAGILQPPYYSAKADRAVNFGGAGAVIGHELTHGFDDQGRQFDARGNLKDWWTEADGKAFVERSQCFVDEYSQFTAVEEVKVNGKLTLGENVADNGGLRLSLMAYLAANTGDAKTIDGFSPEQRVFLAWGQVWCENRRPEALRLMAQTNPHSPGRYRVNGVVSNMPEFQKAFSCKPDAPMVRQTQCRVW